MGRHVEEEVLGAVCGNGVFVISRWKTFCIGPGGDANGKSKVLRNTAIERNRARSMPCGGDECETATADSKSGGDCYTIYL